jgi:hypothetical protein
MRAQRLTLVLLMCATSAYAQGEIDMDPDPDPQPEQTEAQPEPPAEQPVVKDPKIAKKWQRAADQLIRKGDQLAKKGNDAEAKTQYVNAVTAYNKAIEASDDVSLNYYLAIAEDKAGNTPDAIKHLKLVLAAESGVKADILKKAQAKQDEMSMKVGMVTLTIDPEGTQISIGGQVIGEAPLKEPLILMPGDVTVSLTAVGYQPKDVELKPEAGSESERKISLDPVPVVIKQVVKEEPEPEPEKAPPPSKLPLYIGAGVTGALVVTATITGIMAVGQHGTFTDPMSNANERLDAQSNGRTLAHVTDICIAGGVVAAGFTAYWYLKKYKPASAAFSERQAKLDVVPWVQPEAGGLVAVGSF